MNNTPVLIVGDETSMRELIAGPLKEDGYYTASAATAEDALKASESTFFPIVITDISLPDMHGAELIKKLKDIDETTQVIAVSHHYPLEYAADALQQGAYDCLIKPLNDKDIIRLTIGRAADKAKLIQENRSLVTQLQERNKELIDANKFLKEMQIRDGLTGLHNHRHFHEALDKELARAIRHHLKFVILILDIDHFDQFNNAHGYPSGDEVLRKIVWIIQRRLRKSDLATRYGGEEFALILPETDKEGAIQLAHDLGSEIARYPFKGRDQQPNQHVSASIGIAVYPEHGDTPKRLVEKAEHALHIAKHNGRNQAICADSEGMA